MEYDIKKIFEIISESVDAVYITDVSKNYYEKVKDNEFFHNLFGENGSFHFMMNSFMTGNLGKDISEKDTYHVFFKNSDGFKGKFANKSRMRVGDTERIISMINIPLDEDKSALVVTELGEDNYLQDLKKIEKVSVLKSAFLFSMNVDLIADTCSNMAMSEVENDPVNEFTIPYTKWRESITHMFNDEDRPVFLECTSPEYLKANLGYNRTKSIDCQMMNLEGNFIWVKLIFNRVDTGSDEDFRFIFMVEDIHESHIRLINELRTYENMAMTDSMTKLFNHGRIETELQSCLENARKENIPVSLIMFDIDHFKRVNDTYGHATGDYVLKTLSSLANRFLKKKGCMLGRWGGEEFLGICKGLKLEQMYETAEELRKIISENEFKTVGHITSSFGVIEISENESAAEAFERIDNSLYKAKEGGRNRVIKD